jgi:hypothetical protein
MARAEAEALDRVTARRSQTLRDLHRIVDQLARHKRVAGEPGLYFAGLHFLYSISSTMIHGVGRAAVRIVEAIVTRTGVARVS